MLFIGLTTLVAALLAGDPVSPPAPGEAAVCRSAQFTNDATLADRQISACNALISKGGDVADVFYSRAAAYFSKGDYVRSDADFARVLALEPANAEAWNGRGINAVKAGRIPEALAYLDKAVALEPDFAVAYNNRGKAFQLNRQWDQSLESYDKAYDLLHQAGGDPAWLYVVLLGRGATYQNLSRYDRAISDYEEAIKLAPDRPEAYTDRGVVRYRLKAYEAAIGDFDIALRLGDDDRALVAKGLALRDSGRIDAALELFDRVLASKPQDVNVLVDRCLTRAMRTELLTDALKDCDEAVRVSSGAAEAVLDQGLVYYRLHRIDDAIACAEVVLRRQPKAGRALFLRGVARRAGGDRAAGDADIASAVAINPNIPADAKPFGLVP